MNHKILKFAAIALTLAMLFCTAVGCGKKQEDAPEATVVPEEGTIVQRTISPTIDNTVQPTAAPTGEPTSEPSTIPSTSAVPNASAQPSQNAQSAAQTTPAAGAEAVAYANAADINVREKGEADAQIVGTLPINTLVYVAKKDAGSGWSEVLFNGNHAFVATHLLNFISDTGEVKPECTASVVDDGINVRAEATTDAEALGKIAKSETVNVLKKDVGNGWTMILYEERIAFVATYLLSFNG